MLVRSIKVFALVQEWKNKNGLTSCLQTPQPHYDVMKKAIFHGIICFSKTDHPVRIMKVPSLLKRSLSCIATPFLDKLFPFLLSHYVSCLAIACPA